MGAYALMTQFTGGAAVGAVVGHACVLHASDLTSVRESGHALPPLAAAVTTVRTNCCTPPPHTAEHEPVS